MRHVVGLTIIIAWLAGPALADIVLPGSNHGTDGVFAPTASIQIDLGKAQSGPGITWESPGGDMDSDGIGDGVYDRTKWAVVFKFSSVNIPSGVTVTFKNHPSCAPVVWLVQGNVMIAGTVALNGESQTGSQARPANPGPGGFRGGVPLQNHMPGSAGFGPSGAGYRVGIQGSGGGYGTIGAGPYPGATYSSASVLPLIGGAGGSARGSLPGSNSIPLGGGAGGGAILMATPGIVTLNGRIEAIGGNSASDYSVPGGPGAGGAIRLICDSLAGATSGRLLARAGSAYVGYAAGAGRIRVEANDVSLQHQGDPAYSAGLPGITAQLWPESTAPTVRPVSLGGQSIPVDPRSQMDFPYQDMTLNPAASIPLVISAENVPLDWEVKVRVVPRHGIDSAYTATYLSGNQASSTWEAQIPGLPDGFSAIQVRASKP